MRQSKINPVDAYVGNKIRIRRKLLGLSQQQIGRKINKTFQQVQKYENGANKVSASILFEISTILNVDISYFFEELENTFVPLDIDDESLVINKETESFISYIVTVKPANRKAILAFLNQISFFNSDD